MGVGGWRGTGKGGGAGMSRNTHVQARGHMITRKRALANQPLVTVIEEMVADLRERPSVFNGILVCVCVGRGGLGVGVCECM